jgi:hypothetical protein
MGFLSFRGAFSASLFSYLENLVMILKGNRELLTGNKEQEGVRGCFKSPVVSSKTF